MENFHEHHFFDHPGRAGAPRGGHRRRHPERDPRGFHPGGPGRRGRRHDGPDFGPGGFGPGFGPGAHFGRGRGRGGRGRRGDVRAAILLLLAEEPMHGYELIQQIVDRSDGVWKPSPGSIYPALAQLEDEGLVVIEKVAGRKTARLTDEGTLYVETNKTDLGTPWDDVRNSVGGGSVDLRGLIGSLMGAAGQVAAVGTNEQQARAADVLAEARRALYRLLAEDDTRSAEEEGSAAAKDGADEAGPDTGEPS
ncbi:PadR family transcriptional regulator [Rhodococcus triatomae]|uniref:DNA-binding transcriptional regulator, PadR family n=1 Tax=Rhodococcus triatomae TaxID=300028 RepID=A0A1G8KF08_9NOCA|nr:PadR family transcriptional regulator [Rhodococcus triatomae]QNG25925.1 PadR family transcriptional regulator [Rhodococcus triatomae]SDI41997.1 DNA-binding transcriptional regulator, PadR family [Rhodococcus triatomae]